MNFLEQITANMAPGPHYESDDESLLPPVNPLIRLIAFYLPQFHAIPENDFWWGTGFTEWTNVTKAVPRFAGHYQPRLPGALGFYDASRAEILARQAAMAKKYGITGFCFHHYWFQGRRILEKPLETLLADPSIDLPFCVNWANESWTRRWDGGEKSVLLQQEHSVEDSLAFARSLEPLFRDKRYIRINGRPLLLIYRPGLFPDTKQTVSLWRNHFVSEGIGDPYIAMVQRHGDGDASKYGMDSAVGFPPFYLNSDVPRRSDLELFDPKFHGTVQDYQALAKATIESYGNDDRTFPGVSPAWDNDSRTPGRGTCFTGSTPALYGSWLSAACRASMRNFGESERLVFVNAWNEWAEGAYLEPDRHFGFAYLAETRRVLSALSPNLMTEPQSQSGEARSVSKQTFRLLARRFARETLNYFADIAEEVAWALRGR